jgi:hypothetical protein
MARYSGAFYFLFFSALFSMLLPTLATSLPTPDMVLQPAITAIANMAAMIFRYMTASLREARSAGKRYSEAAGSGDAYYINLRRIPWRICSLPHVIDTRNKAEPGMQWSSAGDRSKARTRSLSCTPGD